MIAKVEIFKTLFEAFKIPIYKKLSCTHIFIFSDKIEKAVVTFTYSY